MCGNKSASDFKLTNTLNYDTSRSAIMEACMAGVKGEGAEGEKTREKWQGAGEEKGEGTGNCKCNNGRLSLIYTFIFSLLICKN